MTHATDDDCWFCRKPVGDAAAPHELRLGPAATAVAVPRCARCQRTQRLAIAACFATLLLGAVVAAGFAIAAFLATGPGADLRAIRAARSGMALLGGMGTVLGLVVYRVVLAVGKTRGQRHALEHPEARRARGLAVGAVRSDAP
ncbi:MAG: hypothetical protein U1E73_10130 [Planctomycetota bacterium]